MPDPIPSDDLYERLGVPRDADTASIDRAWRALLKRHHPDVAGAESLEAAKRINVAHDWLADPGRRARYDAARHAPRRGARGSAARRPGRPQAPPPGSEADPRPPDGLDEAFGASAPDVRAFFGRLRTLSRDDLDRLSVSAPDVAGPSLRPFVPTELWVRVDALERLLPGHLPPAILADANALASARSFGHALVLEPFIAQHFAHPDDLLERMRRGWEASVGQPRYGPNGREVRALIERFRRVTPADAAALVTGWAALGSPDEPWPADARPEDYAALSVSAALARRDAAAAPNLDAVPADQQAELRSAFVRTAHVVALRPIFSPRERAWFRTAWAALGIAEREREPVPRVRRT